MKAFLAGFATAVVAAVLLVLWQGVRNGEWIISFIKSPGLMALRDIQADMSAKRYDLAGKKIDVFLSTWEKFDRGPDSCSGTGIRDIIVTFSEMPGGIKATNVDDAANQGQAVSLETNRTSVAGSEQSISTTKK